jgi:hypothetical protein
MDALYVPRGATLREDAGGQYVAYHRACTWNGCGVELTSRNRSKTGALRCIPCGHEAMREVSRGGAGGRKVEPLNPVAPRPPAIPAIRADPPYHLEHQEKQKVYALMTAFLCAPTVAVNKELLLAELVTYEIRERMWRR